MWPMVHGIAGSVGSVVYLFRDINALYSVDREGRPYHPSSSGDKAENKLVNAFMSLYVDSTSIKKIAHDQ